MLRVAKCIKGFGFEELSMHAFEVAKQKMRKLPRKVEVIEQITAFLGERVQRNEMIIAKFTRYLHTMPEKGLPWTAQAEQRLGKIPVASLRRMITRRVEEQARKLGRETIDLEAYEAGRGTGDLE